MFFDVRFERDEVLVNEGSDFGVGIRLGFQPSAAASGRRRAEIDQQRLLPCFRVGHCGIDVSAPLNAHDVALHAGSAATCVRIAS
jgi:hypothetical protein